MEIRSEHAEWAAVHRLALLLEEGHPEYKLTHAFGLFVPILCWTVQRLRAPDMRQHALVRNLEAEDARQHPWDAPHQFNGLSALKYLIALRNCVGHGDARNVRPANRGGSLVGFEFCCEERERGQVIWQASVTLKRHDLNRIGLELSNRFCDALSGADYLHEQFTTAGGEIAEVS